MKKIIELHHIQDYRLALTFDDGVSGELDFSSEPRTGVFEAWNNPEFFKQVHIGDRGRTLVWPQEMDLCADSLWIQLTKKNPADLFPALAGLTTHA
jgi:hypothetical protein